jgi:hypothetical protein
MITPLSVPPIAFDYPYVYMGSDMNETCESNEYVLLLVSFGLR